MFPLANYAAIYWTKYARYAESEPKTFKGIAKFFLTHTQAYTSWTNLFDPDEPWNRNPLRHRRVGTKLYYAALTVESMPGSTPGLKGDYL